MILTADRVGKLEADVHEILRRLRLVESNQARSEEIQHSVDDKFDGLNKRFDRLDANLTRLGFILLAGLVIPAVIFFFGGGITIGTP